MRPAPRTLPLLLAAAAGSASAATIEHVGPVAPDTLGVEVQSLTRVPGETSAYTPRPGDEVDPKSRRVTRDGEPLGVLVGRDDALLHTFDSVRGEPVDPELLEDPAGWSVTDASGRTLRPVSVARKTKPTDEAELDTWSFAHPLRHRLYLRFERPLEAGVRYTLHAPADASLEAPDAAPAFTPGGPDTRSEAVHVTQLGFRPDDPVKAAHLSLWAGDRGGVDYPAGLPFRVVDAAGRTAFEGTAELSLAADRLEAARGRNYAQTDVHRLGFAGLRRPGTYRVVVEGVGSSFPFEVAEDAWEEPFRVAMQGLLHHRSGIELGPPFTDYRRPRTMVPGEDGFRVIASEAPLLPRPGEPGGQEGTFERLKGSGTGEEVPDAWGGYMDAGDWDRRAQHLYATRLLLELYELHPGFLGGFALRLPAEEAGNDLPDVLDEALFNLDFYRRMQTPAGGVRGGIESAGHPRFGETSWQESLPVYAFAPDPYASYAYAATAARAARLLADTHPGLSTTYRETAASAFAWAEAELDAGGWDPGARAVRDERNLAALELHRLTAEGPYHRVFLATTAFTDPDAPLQVWGEAHQGEHAFAYLLLDPALRDAGVAANARRALLADADRREQLSRETGFGWTNDPFGWVGWGQQTTLLNALSLVHAHVLTGEPKYLEAVLRGSRFGAGDNPSNTVFTTGLGHRSVRHPLHLDSADTNQPPPAGITVYGPHDERAQGEDAPLYWATKKLQEAGAIHPHAKRWPPLESWWDVKMHPAANEYTIHQTLGPNAYVWGHLAALDRHGPAD